MNSAVIPPTRDLFPLTQRRVLAVNRRQRECGQCASRMACTDVQQRSDLSSSHAKSTSAQCTYVKHARMWYPSLLLTPNGSSTCMYRSTRTFSATRQLPSPSSSCSSTPTTFPAISSTYPSPNPNNPQGESLRRPSLVGTCTCGSCSFVAMGIYFPFYFFFLIVFFFGGGGREAEEWKELECTYTCVHIRLHTLVPTCFAFRATLKLQNLKTC